MQIYEIFVCFIGFYVTFQHNDRKKTCNGIEVNRYKLYVSYALPIKNCLNIYCNSQIVYICVAAIEYNLKSYTFVRC